MQGMQGKALHYYRTVLSHDPQNIDAVAGEGETLAEKGALEKARENRPRWKVWAGKGGDAANRLRPPLPKVFPNAAPKVVSAADVAGKPATQSN
jgi:hypothetical protein